MNETVYAQLLEPVSASKKEVLLKRATTGNAGEKIDVDEVKKELKSQRTRNINAMKSLVETLQRTLSKKSSLSCYRAENGSEAAEIIEKCSADDRTVFSNNSGVVQEISSDLHDVGIDVEYNYLSGRAIRENRLNYPWLLPDSPCETQEDWFKTNREFALSGEEPTIGFDATALIGVNSVSADDGSFYLLQHSSNIERLLQARRIIFLVGFDKIVASGEEALFQTRWAGNFGLQNLLLNLVEKKDDIADLERENGFESRALIENVKRREVTVVLVDNGRSEIADSPFKSVLHCISCRSCMRECPTYKFFGKKYGRYPQQYLFSFLIGKIPDIDLCCFCNNCSFECPVGIDIAKMNSMSKGNAHSAIGRCKTRLLGNAELLSTATKLTLPISAHLFKNRLFKRVLDATVGIHRNRTLPVYDSTEMIESAEPVNSRKKKKTIIYYSGCWSSFFEHDVFNGTVRFFEQLGYRLIIPENKCCGLPLIASGEVDAAKKKAERLIKDLRSLDPDADIITTCPSCSLALKKDYRDLGVEGEEKISHRVYDALEYILNLDEVRNGRIRFNPLHERIAYHLPCHQRVQNLGDIALKAMKLIPDLEVADVERGCCGISGAWGQKKQFYDFSMVTGEEVFEPVREGGYTLIATECGTCKLQMVHGTGLTTKHPIMLLADQLAVDEKEELSAAAELYGDDIWLN